jgi:hypothetical protein
MNELTISGYKRVHHALGLEIMELKKENERLKRMLVEYGDNIHVCQEELIRLKRA